MAEIVDTKVMLFPQSTKHKNNWYFEEKVIHLQQTNFKTNFMEKKRVNLDNFTVKVSVIVFISILLLIPLSLVKGLIRERESTKRQAENEIAASVGGMRLVCAPELIVTNLVKPATDSTDMITESRTQYPKKTNYDSKVNAKKVRRSIYDVIILESETRITGEFAVTDNLKKSLDTKVRVRLDSDNGFMCEPSITICGSTYEFELDLDRDGLIATVDLPSSVEVGDSLAYELTLSLRGTGELNYKVNAENTTLKMESSYPHPSFKGDYLPNDRSVADNGFVATWSVVKIGMSDGGLMTVSFVDPVDAYQQATRSAKYGMMIIVLVFLAGLFVEFATKKKISVIQYAVIGLSLVLFYSLLLSFSDFIAFGLSYIIAAVMTLGALVFYFRAILKNRSAYLLGGFTGLVYVINYTLLQMGTYALLSGTLILFVLLLAVMYFTADPSKFVEKNDQ